MFISRLVLVIPFILLVSACGGSSGDTDPEGTEEAGTPGTEIPTPETPTPETPTPETPTPETPTPETPTPETPTPETPTPETPTSETPTSETLPTGEFTLLIDGEISEGNGALLIEFLQPRIDFVNGVTKLPTDIPVNVTFCGIANAFYISELNEEPPGPAIFMCSELVDEIFGFYSDLLPEDTGLATTFALSAYSFIMQHEMAHAFDEQLDLPIVGNLESGADAIATVLSVEQGLGELVVFAALLFDTTEDGSFGAIHPGGADRAGDLYCWTTGGDSELAIIFPELVSDLEQIFADAGRDCVSEYAGLRSDVIRWLPGLETNIIASATGSEINSNTPVNAAFMSLSDAESSSWTVPATPVD